VFLVFISLQDSQPRFIITLTGKMQVLHENKKWLAGVYNRARGPDNTRQIWLTGVYNRARGPNKTDTPYVSC